MINDVSAESLTFLMSLSNAADGEYITLTRSGVNGVDTVVVGEVSCAAGVKNSLWSFTIPSALGGAIVLIPAFVGSLLTPDEVVLPGNAPRIFYTRLQMTIFHPPQCF